MQALLLVSLASFSLLILAVELSPGCFEAFWIKNFQEKHQILASLSQETIPWVANQNGFS